MAELKASMHLYPPRNIMEENQRLKQRLREQAAENEKMQERVLRDFITKNSAEEYTNPAPAIAKKEHGNRQKPFLHPASKLPFIHPANGNWQANNDAYWCIGVSHDKQWKRTMHPTHIPNNKVPKEWLKARLGPKVEEVQKAAPNLFATLPQLPGNTMTSIRELQKLSGVDDQMNGLRHYDLHFTATRVDNNVALVWSKRGGEDRAVQSDNDEEVWVNLHGLVADYEALQQVHLENLRLQDENLQQQQTLAHQTYLLQVR
jgi:hypothetical protein